MRRLDRMVGLVLVAAVLALPGCMREAPARPAAHPSEVEALEGTDVARVTLTPRAVERLGIVTVPLARVDVVRRRMFVGDVVPVPAALESNGGAAAGAAGVPAASASLAVRVDLDDIERGDLDLDDDALMIPSGRPASPVASDAAAADHALVYVVQGAGADLPVGERVQLEIPIASAGGARSVVPYGALLYDVNGDAWVYISTAAGTYQRAPVVVDYIEDDQAVLLDGPDEGTPVVSVGAAELFGTEFGVGH